MRLESVTAALRPRGKHEAADLGLALTRRHYAGVIKAMLCFCLPLWAVLAWLLRDHPMWLMTVMWWLKPLYSRVTVFYLGNTLFDSAPPLREQWRAWPGLLTRRILPALLWKRLSPYRALTDPVVALEGLKGKRYTARTGILGRHAGDAATGLTLMALTLEQAVLLGTAAVTGEFVPADVWEDWSASITHFSDFSGILAVPAAITWSIVAAYGLAVLLVEPFYSGAGFGLYVNARTELEGWDIELVFRKIAARLAPAPVAAASAGPPALPPVACFAPVALLFAQAAAEVEVEPETVTSLDVDTAGETVRQVLSHPDFHEHSKTLREWKWDWKPDWDFSWLEWFKWLAASPAILLYILGGGLLLWLCVWLWRNRGNFRRAPAGEVTLRTGPRTVMGMDVAPESLPSDIPHAARAAWENGDREGALRLLYRGALAWLSATGAPLRESDTEGDCLRHSRALPEGVERGYFARLTGVWLSAAYAKSPPANSAAEALFRDWPFSAAAVSPKKQSTAFSSANALLALCGGVFLTGCSGHWETTTKELGHRGEAARNPWLAAERFLEETGYTVEHLRGVARLPEHGGVLIVSSDSMTSVGAANQVFQWAERGGHVIHIMEGGQMHRNDWNEGWGAIFAPDADMLLQRLGARRVNHKEVTATSSGSGTSSGSSPGSASSPSPSTTPASASVDVVIDGVKLKTMLNDEPVIDLRGVILGTPEILSGELEAARLATLPLGNGRVTLVANGRVFRNRYIDDDNHAALLERLLWLHGSPTEVLFAGGGRVTLRELLMEYGWQSLLAAALLLAAWLWRHTIRFGPARPAPARSTATFLSHLEDSGAFLWRQKLTASLLAAPRAAVLLAASRKSIPPEEPDLIPKLAARAGLPEERVAAALNDDSADNTDGRQTIRRMADLQTIQQSL